MPEALDLLKTRRSVKPIELTGPGPAPAELDTLLTVASRVPDHGKLTPWRFIVFEGDARLKAGETIAAVFKAEQPAGDRRAGRVRAQAAGARAAGDRGGEPRRAACEDPRMGAGALRRRRRDEPGDGRACARLRGELDHRMVRLRPRACSTRSALAPNEKIAGFVHIGRPAKPPEDRPRPPLARSSRASALEGL